MSRAWFIVWALVIWQVAAWAFAPQKTAQQPAAPVDGPGYGSNEEIFVDGRAGLRRETALASSRHCCIRRKPTTRTGMGCSEGCTCRICAVPYITRW